MFCKVGIIARVRKISQRHFEGKIIPKQEIVDVTLSPKMISTGEWMRISSEFPSAFAMAQIAAGQTLPLISPVFLSFNDLTKPHLDKIAVSFFDLGFKILANLGKSHFLETKGIPVDRVLKLPEGDHILLTWWLSDSSNVDLKLWRCKVLVITTVAGKLHWPWLKNQA